jgi:hypothetical protein
MAKESKKDILTELSGHLAAAADCVSFVRDKEVSDANAISDSDSEWAKEKYRLLMSLLEEVDSKRGR